MEKIICAAIWYELEETPVHTVNNLPEGGVVLCGFRHSDIIGQYLSLTGKSTTEAYVQGFLTDKKRFVNRKEGAKIAIAAHQIVRDEFNGVTLYSEDLY